MNFKNLVRGIMAIAFMASAYSADAKIIEHIGDRYIIHVDEMELNGEETVLDVLLMCPEITSNNGSTTASPYYMGEYRIRINNNDITMDAEMFLKNTRAKEIKKIQVCINPGVMKGSGNMKKVIDLYFRTPPKGTHGKVAVEADTKASGEILGRVITQSDKAWIAGQLAGKMTYANQTHQAIENANINAAWDITDKDQLLLQVAQYYNRSRADEAPCGNHDRTVTATACYTRSLSDNGAYAMFQLSSDYTTFDQQTDCYHSASPCGVLEFGFPFISKNIYITAGIESGYSTTKNVKEDYTNNDFYEDLYAQFDWTNGKWGVMVGDRIHLQYFKLSRYVTGEEDWEHSISNNFFTTSVWCNINDHNTVQGTFARRFFGATHEDFGLPEYGYTTDVYQCPIYVSEARYTYQQHNFNLMATVKNEHKKLINNIGSDNILTAGFSAFAHVGVLRFTLGCDYNWERINEYNYHVNHGNWVSCHVSPQVSLKKGWRFTANAIYNSRRMKEDIDCLNIDILNFYTQPNFYLDVAASKQINKHWLVEARWHDIVDTRIGARGVYAKGTYTF